MATVKEDKKIKKVKKPVEKKPSVKKVKTEKVKKEKVLKEEVKEEVEVVEVEKAKIEEEEISDSKNEAKKDKGSKKGLFTGTGRRKTSTARVFLWEKKGDFTVNDMSINDYFESNVDKVKWEKPFHAIGISHPEAKYSATIKVAGSGKPSQMDAIVLGISRALSKIDTEFENILSKQGFMTRDSRMVERKKPFLHKARKRPQYSKR